MSTPLHDSLEDNRRLHDELLQPLVANLGRRDRTPPLNAMLRDVETHRKHCSIESLREACDDLAAVLPGIHASAAGADSASDRATEELAACIARLREPGLAWPGRRRLLIEIQLRQAQRIASIPRLIHFIKSDADPARLAPINYLSLKSALLHCPHYRIVLHTPVRPTGPLWEELLEHIELNLERPPGRLGDHTLGLAAHQADVWRVQKLIEMGGFYFDWDVILLRDPDALRSHACVMGVEGLVPGFREVLGVSAIGAQPQAVFLKCWLSGMAAAFNPADYVAHSTVLAQQLALSLQGAVRVLPSSSFYEPGWSAQAMEWLFSPARAPDDDALATWAADAYGLHLFESHANFLRWGAGWTLDDLRGLDCNFSRLVQPVLEMQLA